MTNKTMLSKAIRERLRELSYKQEDYALDERLEHDTFRAQLTRNTFSTHSLQAAANLLTDGNVDVLKTKYQFEVTSRGKETVLQPTQSIRERVNRMIKTPSSELVEDIQRLYSWLKPNDLAIISSLDESPLEATKSGWNSMKEPMSKAIDSGTIFVYIRPTEDYIKKMLGPLSKYFSRRSPAEEHEELRSNLIAAGIKRKDVNMRVKLVQPDWCPFWVIGMRFGFYSIASEDGGRRDMTLFARFPFGGSMPGERSVDPNLLVFGDQRMRDAFHDYIVDCFENDDDLKPLLERLR